MISTSSGANLISALCAFSARRATTLVPGIGITASCQALPFASLERLGLTIGMLREDPPEYDLTGRRGVFRSHVFDARKKREVLWEVLGGIARE